MTATPAYYEAVVAAVQRVRDAHPKCENDGVFVCGLCLDRWPCQTIKALDGNK